MPTGISASFVPFAVLNTLTESLSWFATHRSAAAPVTGTRMMFDEARAGVPDLPLPTACRKLYVLD